SRLLSEDRASGSQVTDATVAEPAATRNHVTALGNAQLPRRLLDEILIRRRSAGNRNWINQRPTILVQQSDVPRFSGMNAERHEKRLIGQRREIYEFPEGVNALPVELAAVFNGAIAAPMAYARKAALGWKYGPRPKRK